MFGIDLPDLLLLVVIFGIPVVGISVGIVALIMALTKSRQRRQLRHRITNEDYASFVGIKAEEYLPKFKRFSVHEMDNFRVTWHWPAFFVPFWWMLYRKLYGWAILAFFTGFISCITIRSITIFCIRFFTDNISSIIGIIPNLLLRVVWAITANYIYYKHAKKKLLKIKQSNPSPEAQRAVIAVKGGVRPVAVTIALLTGFGIMFVIGIRMMRTQEVRGRLFYVTNTMADVAHAEVMFKVDMGRYEDCVDAGEIQSKLGVAVKTKYITEIKVAGGTITATIGNTDSDADGKTLTLTREATCEAWIWGGTVPAKYIREKMMETKLTCVFNTMCCVAELEARVKVEEGGYKDCADASEIQTKLGVTVNTKYITEIKVAGGTITATIGNTNSIADGKTLTLTPEATGEAWIWGGTVPEEYKPRRRRMLGTH
jgi:uncharacterized protein with FMN-binding domain